MKRILSLIIVLFLATSLVSCGGKKVQQPAENAPAEAPAEDNAPAVAVEVKEPQAEAEVITPEEQKNDGPLSLDEWWEVPGQWKLKIDSVTETDYRNEFSDKDPAQVVIITYTYENLGYEGRSMDLFITPDKVIDEGKKIAATYPAKITTHPQEIPEGVICEGAQDAFGLITESNTIKIIFEKYTDDSDLEKITFEVPVEK